VRKNTAGYQNKVRRFDLKTRGITWLSLCRIIGEEKQRIEKDRGESVKCDGPGSPTIIAKRRISRFTLKCIKLRKQN